MSARLTYNRTRTYTVKFGDVLYIESENSPSEEE